MNDGKRSKDSILRRSSPPASFYACGPCFGERSASLRCETVTFLVLRLSSSHETLTNDREYPKLCPRPFFRFERLCVSEPKFWLLPVHGGSPIELTKPLTLVGRQEDCDLALDHKTISKHHCILMQTDGAVLLRDLGSTNGCRINGQKMKSGAILPNDVFSIAVFDFRLFIGANAPGAAPPSVDKTELVDLSELAALDGGPKPSHESPSRHSPEKPAKEESRGGGLSIRE
jgi:hypothetical protein